MHNYRDDIAGHRWRRSKHVRIAREPVCLAGMAMQWNLPLETVKASSELFRMHAESSGGEILKDGRLSPAAFSQLVCTLAGVSNLEELCNETSEDGMIPDDYMNFEDFAAWYHRRAFSNYVNLPKDGRQCRDVALALGIPMAEAEHCKHIFDKFDFNQDGRLDEREFASFVSTLYGHWSFDSRKNYDLPESRIHQMWQQCNHNGTPTVSFKEFAAFYSVSDLSSQIRLI